jgi:hypothetical protein
MAIVFSCTCGKQLRAVDEFAGRTIKCPTCQTRLVVPQAAANGPASRPKPQPAATSAEVIRFACACGKQMQAKAKFAGQEVDCPACGAAVMIPEAGAPRPEEGIVKEPRPKARPAPALSATEDEDDELDDRPTRSRGRRKPARRQKAPLWPWVAAAAAVLLIGGGVTAWLVWPKGEDTGEDTAFIGELPPDLKLLPPDALGIVSVRAGDVWNSVGKDIQQAMGPMQVDLAREMEKAVGLQPADIERVTFVVPTEDMKTSWGVALTRKAVDQKKLLATAGGKVTEKSFQGKTYHVDGDTALYFVSPTVVVLGSTAGVETMLRQTSQPAGGGSLGEGLKAIVAKKHNVVVALHPPAAALQKMVNTPLGPGSPLNQQDLAPFANLRKALITANLGDPLALDLRLTFSDEANARQAKATGDKLLDKVRELWPVLKQQLARGPNAAMVQQVDAALQKLRFDQRGPAVTTSLQLPGQTTSAVLVGLLVPAVQKVRQAAERVESQNNLRMLGLAMHDYAGTFTKARFPSPSIGGGLSWRVALLPYLEQDELYKQFHLNEPWNSPHNIKLLNKMPKVFAHPSAKFDPPNMTRYQLFVGPGTPFQGNQAPQLPGGFPKGVTNTILIAEAGRAVPWTKPEDITYDPRGPLPVLGVVPGQFNAALADASVRIFQTPINQQVLRAMIAPTAK